MGLIGVRVRDEEGEMSMGLFDKKVKDAFAVATSMVGFVQSEEDSEKWKWERELREKDTNFDCVRFLGLGQFYWAINQRE